MVLEALINPVKAEQKPWETFFIGIIYASIAVIISMYTFNEFASIVIVSLTAMVSIPLIYGAIKLEEKKDLVIEDERHRLMEHEKVLQFLTFLFLGFVAAYSFWFATLPESAAQSLFQLQINTVSDINGPTGNFFNVHGSFGIILSNNLRVLLFCLLFAFLYGFGAIFILTWNASVIATVIGGFIRVNSLALTPFVLIRYLLHGIPEILAYFMAGLAGGIISIAVIRHDFESTKFKKVVIDSLYLSGGAVVLLFIAALLEVYVSPLVL